MSGRADFTQAAEYKESALSRGPIPLSVALSLCLGLAQVEAELVQLGLVDVTRSVEHHVAAGVVLQGKAM